MHLRAEDTPHAQPEPGRELVVVGDGVEVSVDERKPSVGRAVAQQELVEVELDHAQEATAFCAAAAPVQHFEGERLEEVLGEEVEGDRLMELRPAAALDHLAVVQLSSHCDTHKGVGEVLIVQGQVLSCPDVDPEEDG
eukprot:486519-Hanusia_phi.AAC.5